MLLCVIVCYCWPCRRSSFQSKFPRFPAVQRDDNCETMFESEDFDLDEDFLKDVGEKEEQYYSQRNNSDSSCAEPSPKRHKVDLQSDLSDITFDNEPDFARNASKSTGKTSRESDSVQILPRKQTQPEVREASQPHRHDENVESRRNLALEILRKAASKDESEPKSSPWTPSPLRQISPGGQRISQNVSRLQEIRQKPSPKIFRKPSIGWNESPAKKTFADSPKYRSGLCVTLVRKFPGPAGLLPDSHDSSLGHQNLLKNLDEHKANIGEKLNDPSMSEYCSQNTERLFSVGAWRAMLDDLPRDFLKGHEIATIKRLARNNCSNSENSRASFLAGVVQWIDHSVENPRLVLKDLSDSIEATMHRDIPLTYPNILEVGVVILLRNVGLLGFKGSQLCPGLQFHVMIAPKNVLAVYNDKARLVTSSWMESMRAEGSDALDTPRVSEGTETAGKAGEYKIDEATICRETSMHLSDFDNDVDEVDFACVETDVIKESQVTASLFKAPEIVKGKESTESRTDREPIEKSPKVPKAAECAENIVIRPKSMSSVRSRLLQYRSKDVLTPVLDSDNVEDNESRDNSKRDDEGSKFGTFGDDLLNSDNDTDDEIISQLDVNSIVTSYNSGT